MESYQLADYVPPTSGGGGASSVASIEPKWLRTTLDQMDFQAAGARKSGYGGLGLYASRPTSVTGARRMALEEERVALRGRQYGGGGPAEGGGRPQTSQDPRLRGPAPARPTTSKVLERMRVGTPLHEPAGGSDAWAALGPAPSHRGTTPSDISRARSRTVRAPRFSSVPGRVQSLAAMHVPEMEAPAASERELLSIPASKSVDILPKNPKESKPLKGARSKAPSSAQDGPKLDDFTNPRWNHSIHPKVQKAPRKGEVYHEETSYDLQPAKTTSEAGFADEFNETVQTLKDKIYQKGPFAVTSHFQALDVDRSGYLDIDEFKTAMALFNLNMSDGVMNKILSTVDQDKSGSIDYREFTDALRMGKIQFMEHTKKAGTKMGPDPELPFGNPRHQQPFGIMYDAEVNLRKFDKRMSDMFSSLEQTFKDFDSDGSGDIDIKEFINVMETMNRTRGLNLSREEMKALFKTADDDGSGEISYSEFMKTFAGGGGKRFIPEFFKPKPMRCSQMGHPWSWDAESSTAEEVQKIGSRAFDYDSAVKAEASGGHLADMLQRRQARNVAIAKAKAADSQQQMAEVAY